MASGDTDRASPARGGRPATSDVILAGALAVSGTVTMLLEPLGGDPAVQRPADAFGVALTLGMTVPLAWRRRAPLTSLVLPGVCALTAFAMGYAATVGLLAVWVALGSAALHTDRRTAIGLGLLGAAAVGGSVVAAADPVTPLIVLGAATTGVLPALVGDALRTQRALAEAERARAERLERLREAHVQRARSEERLNLARDVHDAVGHHLSAIVLQAAAGRTLAVDAGVDDVLATIQRLSAAALEDTRTLLGDLRASGEDARGIEDLEALYDGMRHAGVPVDARHELDMPIPSALQTCAYRIVQEALTNVARHARPRAARVSLRAAGGALLVVVDDDGLVHPGQPVQLRHGLIGMRERTARAGGTLIAGPCEQGGWRVLARLPIASDR